MKQVFQSLESKHFDKCKDVDFSLVQDFTKQVYRITCKGFFFAEHLVSAVLPYGVWVTTVVTCVEA